jgi:hypothetical protein
MKYECMFLSTFSLTGKKYENSAPAHANERETFIREHSYVDHRFI